MEFSENLTHGLAVDTTCSWKRKH